MTEKKLKVHENGRCLVWQNGEPFFYLGDTAWELFHRLNPEKTDLYLQTRAEQGFNVIQAVALAEYGGLDTANFNGRRPLLQTNGQWDPTRPDIGGPDSYWDHVDTVIRKAAGLGLMIGLLPTWGDKYNQKWGQGPEIFTAGNAAVYAGWLAKRYADCWNIIWILGGDRPLESEQHHAIIDAMGQAIRREAPDHLITFHPSGASSSADHVLDRDYIDFHMIQSGHALEGFSSYAMLQATAAAEAKPFMDGEPRYEGHPSCFKAGYQVLWSAPDVRQNAWWNLMEGVCGHTYGHHAIWYFNREKEAYRPHDWQSALRHPGAGQMRHLITLRESRPFAEFHPAPDLVADDPAAGAHLAAGRGDAYAFIYSPLGQPIRARLDQLGDRPVRAAWFNPRDGRMDRPFTVVPPREALFVPPTQGWGEDWVLVLDRMDD